MATHKVSGKKNKFQITIAFACNSTGTDKLCPFFIGKFARPRCFQKKTGRELSFYYRNNKKAWMTSVLFEEWVIGWNLCQRQAYIITGGLRCLTIWCRSNRGKSAFISTTFRATMSPMSQQMLSWSFSHQILHPGFSHSMLASSTVSRLTTDIDSVKKHWNTIQAVRQTYIHLISLKLYTWHVMLGTT